MDDETMVAALHLAVGILARDGLRPLEGLAYTQTERERIERAAGLTVAEVVAEAEAVHQFLFGPERAARGLH